MHTPYLGTGLENHLRSIRKRRGMVGYESGHLVRNVVLLKYIKKTVDADLSGKDAGVIVGPVDILVTTRPEPTRDSTKIDGKGDLGFGPRQTGVGATVSAASVGCSPLAAPPSLST